MVQCSISTHVYNINWSKQILNTLVPTRCPSLRSLYSMCYTVVNYSHPFMQRNSRTFYFCFFWDEVFRVRIYHVGDDMGVPAGVSCRCMSPKMMCHICWGSVASCYVFCDRWGIWAFYLEQKGRLWWGKENQHSLHIWLAHGKLHSQFCAIPST